MAPESPKEIMPLEPVTLQGHHIRLEPLEHRHIDGLLAAAAADPALYQWTSVPQTHAAATRYVETALAARNAGTAIAFATILQENNTVLGSTRFFDLDRLPWPQDHPSSRRALPEVGEIGYTWLTSAALRTAANTEAKLLMLTQAFEAWQMLRICLHTDERNQRSRAAIERIGGRFEGILRAYRVATDLIPRNSARYSILAAEWPEVKENLRRKMESYR